MGKIKPEVILTANKYFRKSEKKKIKTAEKETKKSKETKAGQYDRENSPRQNGEDF
jgi:hypothetical protein